MTADTCGGAEVKGQGSGTRPPTHPGMAHLLPDGFSRVLLQGQLGRVGQRLLHRQVAQQVVALERKTPHPGKPDRTPLDTMTQLSKDKCKRHFLLLYFRGFGPICQLGAGGGRETTT